MFFFYEIHNVLVKYCFKNKISLSNFDIFVAEMSMGTRMILPYVTTILDYLKKVVANFAQKKSNKNSFLPETELTILSK